MVFGRAKEELNKLSYLFAKKETSENKSPIRAREEDGIIIISGPIENPEKLCVVSLEPWSTISIEGKKGGQRKADDGERFIVKRDYLAFQGNATGTTADGKLFRILGEFYSQPLNELEYQIETADEQAYNPREDEIVDVIDDVV